MWPFPKWKSGYAWLLVCVIVMLAIAVLSGGCATVFGKPLWPFAPADHNPCVTDAVREVKEGRADGIVFVRSRRFGGYHALNWVRRDGKIIVYDRRGEYSLRPSDNAGWIPEPTQ